MDVNIISFSIGWRMYQLDDEIPDDWYIIAEQPEKRERLDVS